jgi:hypothetical protein
MSDKDVLQIEGSIGDLDYAGITVNAVDFMVETISRSIVAPDVKRRINRITGETESSIKVRREGFFDTRVRQAAIAPTWSVYSDPAIAPWMQVLEYGYGGKNAVMRPSARSRKVKTAIRILLQMRFNKEMRILVRNAKRFKRKT